MTLPRDSQVRKTIPMFRGLLEYFPDALAYVSHVSHKSNEKHNPGEKMHWARGKSTDQEDCVIRHMTDSIFEDFDVDDMTLHKGKAAWRALASLQLRLV